MSADHSRKVCYVSKLIFWECILGLRRLLLFSDNSMLQSRSLSSKLSRQFFQLTSSSLNVVTVSVEYELGRTNLAYTGTCPGTCPIIELPRMDFKPSKHNESRAWNSNELPEKEIRTSMDYSGPPKKILYHWNHSSSTWNPF